MKHNTRASRVTAGAITLIFMLATILTGCASVPVAAVPAQTEAPAVITETSAPSATPAGTTTPDATQAEDVGYVSLDVNPSIQLAIKGGIVLGVMAFNDDGEEIILNCDVVGQTYGNAMDQLIGTLATEGYLAPAETEPSIVITAYGNVEDGLITDIETQAQESLTALGLDCPIYASDVSDEMAEVAKSYGLTPGRYLLISYLANSEGLSMEDAIAKYADMRMGDLTHLVGDALGIYGDLSPLFEGLTDEQITVLTSAKEAYAAAMHAAAQSFRKDKAAAIDAFKAAKEAAQHAFKDSKDNDAWKQAKAAAIAAFQQAKTAAKTAFEDAKATARADFMTAVSELGLDPSLVQQMLEWDFDYNWDYDYNWGGPPEEETRHPESKSQSDKDNPNAGQDGSNGSQKNIGDGKDDKPGNDGHGNKPDKNNQGNQD